MTFEAKPNQFAPVEELEAYLDIASPPKKRVFDRKVAIAAEVVSQSMLKVPLEALRQEQQQRPVFELSQEDVARLYDTAVGEGASFDVSRGEFLGLDAQTQLIALQRHFKFEEIESARS